MCLTAKKYFSTAREYIFFFIAMAMFLKKPPFRHLTVCVEIDGESVHPPRSDTNACSSFSANKTIQQYTFQLMKKMLQQSEIN